MSSSLRSVPKSIRLVRSASAPFSKAFPLRLRIPIGGDHDDGDVRSQCFIIGGASPKKWQNIRLSSDVTNPLSRSWN